MGVPKLFENSTGAAPGGHNNVSSDDIINHPLKSGLLRASNYLIAMNDFLLAGYDFDFFTKENKGIIKVTEPEEGDLIKNDLRKAMIEYLKGKGVFF